MTMGNDRQKVSGWLFHAVVWAALLGMPLFSTLPGRQMVSGPAYIHFLVMVASFMVVFYANWFFLIERQLFSRHVGRFLLWNVVLIAVVMGICHLVFRSLPPPPDAAPRAEHGVGHTLRFLFGNVSIYLLVAAVCVAIRMTREWYRAESLRKDLEKSRTEAELLSLKSQLNPHFLFNTLNNLYSLIQIDAGRAQDAVHDLSRMLRYVLYDSSQPTVPVHKEIEFLSDYIALMRIRLPRHVDLRVALPEQPSSREIAPMLFISLVENAFKHGVSNEQASFIDISIREEDAHLTCDIRNSDFPKTDADRSGSGIGLKNLNQRLEMIYPGQYNFSQHAGEGVFSSRLDIRL